MIIWLKNQSKARYRTFQLRSKPQASRWFVQDELSKPQRCKGREGGEWWSEPWEVAMDGEKGLAFLGEAQFRFRGRPSGGYVAFFNSGEGPAHFGEVIC